MKTITPPTAVVGDGTTKPVASITSPGDTSPVSREILLNLGAIFAEQQVAALLGDESEAVTAKGVIAGIVTTLHRILPANQFHAVMIQWEVDAIKLAEIFELTAAK